MVKYDEHGNCDNDVGHWSLRPHRGEPRVDHSINLRDGLYALWGSGEQLWDVDLNNYALLCQEWLVGRVDQTRDPRANVPIDPDIVSYIDRGITEREDIFYNSRCYPIKDTWCERPQKSKKWHQDYMLVSPLHARFTFSEYDDLMYFYRDRKGWDAIGEVRPCSPRVEISIFCGWAANNDIFAQIVFDTHCKFFAGTAYMSNTNPITPRDAYIAIQKNNEGTVGVCSFISGEEFDQSSVYFSHDVEFKAGDVMKFRCIGGSQTSIAFSFIGQRLNDS